MDMLLAQMVQGYPARLYLVALLKREKMMVWWQLAHRYLCSHPQELVWKQIFALHRDWIAIKRGIREMFDRTSVIDDRKPALLRFKEARATPDDLLEFDDRANAACQHNILAGWHIDARCEQACSGDDDRLALAHGAELIEGTFAIFFIIIDDAHNIAGTCPCGTGLFQGEAHVGGVFVIDTKYNRLMQTWIVLKL